MGVAVLFVFFLLTITLIWATFLLVRSSHFEQFKELLSIIIWPAVVLVILIYFRRVITYLFFSMEEFNFFGVKGELKNVHEMIREKAQELRAQEKNQEDNGKKLQEVIDSSTNQAKQIDGLKKFAQELIQEIQKLNQENTSLKQDAYNFPTKTQLQEQISALLAQIQQLQIQLGQRKGFDEGSGETAVYSRLPR